MYDIVIQKGTRIEQGLKPNTIVYYYQGKYYLVDKLYKTATITRY